MRMIEPAKALADHPDVDVTLIRHDAPEARIKMLMRAPVEHPDGTVAVPETVVGVHEVPDCDVLVMQRPLHRHRYEMIRHLQEAGIAVVVELDDDFEMIHPDNQAYWATRPNVNPDSNWQWLKKACKQADLVTCTTPALARRYARHGRVEVIPNYLPDGMWFRDLGERDQSAVRIGWSGSVSSHPTDLQQTGGAINRVAREMPSVEVVNVGTGAGVAHHLGMRQVRASGWMDISIYPDAIAQFHVGIVPLDLTPFNQAKSALKGLEYAAAGVPFVCTRTDPYRELLADGIGRYADTPADWYREVRRLCSDRQMRHDLGAEWREAVSERWRLSLHADRWAQAWKRARINRDTTSRVSA